MSKRDIPSLEQVQMLHEFMQGRVTTGTVVKHAPKLSPEKSMSVIWFLQEHLNVIPDCYEMCCSCGYIFDSEAEGIYDAKTGKNWCDSCSWKSPARLRKLVSK